MSEGKRKNDGRDKGRRRYRQDGTPVWGQKSIDGPGVWVTCVKGKEKQAVGELYDLFESLSSELWADAPAEKDASDDGEEDIEKLIAKEVTAMKRPRKEQRFATCQTNTPCVVFISCKPPVDPVQLVVTHIQNVVDTGITHTRYAHRFTPVSGTCVANLPEIRSLCIRVFRSFFAAEPGRQYKYKIELKIRNHSTLTRTAVIQEIANCVPEGHKVDLEDAEVFILAEVFKGVCGLSVVKDYHLLHKFNAMEIANKKNGVEQDTDHLPVVQKEKAASITNRDIDEELPRD